MPVTDELIICNLVKKYRHEELEGRPHLVVPCTMLGEAVVSGSEGPVFYPKDVNAESTPMWDAQPIVVYHPKLNGKFVSAKKPQFFNSRKIGILFNTKHDDMLRTECWFDEEKTKKVDERVYEAIVNNQGMEVSTGVGVDWTPVEEAEHNGVKYKKKAVKLKPDHLAILPDQIGAFSRAMGGGLFANMALEPEGLQTVLTASARDLLSRCGVEVIGNELSFSDTTRQLADLLSSTYGEKGRYWRGWIEEVFSDYVVFRSEDGKCYKVGYKRSDGEVSLSGTPKVVTRVTSYETVSNVSQEIPMDKAAYVNTLIGNGWDESDREYLMGLDENRLKKIKPVTPVANQTTPPATPPQTPPSTPPANPPQVPPTPPPPPRQVTVNEWLNDPSVPLPVRQAAQRQMQRDEEYKKTLVTSIMAANTVAGFTEEFLLTKDIPELEGWARFAQSSVKPQQIPMFQDTGFAGRILGTPPMVGNAGHGAPPLEAPLGVPELTFEAKK